MSDEIGACIKDAIHMVSVGSRVRISYVDAFTRRANGLNHTYQVREMTEQPC